MGRGPRGFYVTNISCKDNHHSLENNKSNSLGRLNSIVKNLCIETSQRDQIKGAVEKVDEVCEKEILPHRPVY